jgi:hypothetical protein
MCGHGADHWATVAYQVVQIKTVNGVSSPNPYHKVVDQNHAAWVPYLNAGAAQIILSSFDGQ